VQPLSYYKDKFYPSLYVTIGIDDQHKGGYGGLTDSHGTLFYYVL